MMECVTQISCDLLATEIPMVLQSYQERKQYKYTIQDLSSQVVQSKMRSSIEFEFLGETLQL